MQRLRNVLRFLLPLLRNYYVASTAFLVFWLLFFDANDVVSQIKLFSKLQKLREEKEYYLQKIEEVKEDRREIFGSDKLIERFAREKYLMKKPTEDIYLVRIED